MRRALAIALSACLLMCGCTEGNSVKREENAPKPNTQGRFLCDNSYYKFETVVDSQTGVTYLLWQNGSGNRGVGGITVMLDRDGNPIISEEVAR